MARKTTTTTTEDVGEVESPALQDAQDTVEGIEAELSNETVARIHRTHPNISGGKEHYCGQIDAKLVSPDYLQAQYGGGQYRVQLMGPMKGKGGKMRIGPLKQFRVDVDPSIPTKNPQAATTASPVTGPVSGGTDMNSMMFLQVIETINATRKMETAAIERLLQQPQGPRVDWSPIIAAAITAVPSILVALGQRKDPVELATKLMESMRPPEPAAGAVDQLGGLLDIMGKMGERMQRSAPSEGRESSMWDVIKEYAPVLQQLLVQRGASIHEGPPDVPPEGAPSQQIASAPEPVKTLPPGLAYLSPLLPRLLADAQIGREADVCASYYLAEVPPGHYSTLRSVLASPTLVSDLTTAVPEFLPYAVWVEELRSALLESLSDDRGDGATG